MRLASSTSGHVLAALAAARVAARELETFADLEVLSDACTGAASEPDGRWRTADASGLAFLVAVAIARHPRAQSALDALAVLTSRMAAQARGTDDVDLSAQVSYPNRVFERYRFRFQVWATTAAGQCA